MPTLQAEFRHTRSGSFGQMQPHGLQGGGQQQQQQQGQGPQIQPVQGQPGQGSHQLHHDSLGQRFDGPRSPPNTAHVPCKFFRQGACQAGNSCPFSHDIGAATETICKYFAKGNCKFGPKCANIHILPDGRRVNYGKNGVTIGQQQQLQQQLQQQQQQQQQQQHAQNQNQNHSQNHNQNQQPLGLGSRINPAAYLQPSNSALTNSFLQQSQQQQPPPPSQQQQQQQPALTADFYDIPSIDTSYSPNPASSAYGSPPGQGMGLGQGQSLGQGLGQSLGLAASLGNGHNVLSVLDAPLPASFDSTGISHAARYGPWPASVPSKFGLESPVASSLHTHTITSKDERTSDTLKLLHTSAFGQDHLSPLGTSLFNTGGGGRTYNGSSALDDYASTTPSKGRAMHSSSSRYAKPRLLSSSAPKVDRDRDGEPEFWFLEEDYVPGALANEVLTPQEKARRGSVRHNSNDAMDSLAGLGGLSEAPTQGGLSASFSASASANASATATKYGSPVGTGSPSRFSPWLQQRQRSVGNGLNGIGGLNGLNGLSGLSGLNGLSGSAVEDDFLDAGSVGRSMKHAASAFGHVGSPLRNSSLSGVGSTGRSGSFSNGPGSTASHATANANAAAAAAATTNGESMSMLSQQLQRTRLEPTSSLSTAAVTATTTTGIIGRGGNSSTGTTNRESGGRYPAPIDEEDPSFLFDMEEVDEKEKRKSSTTVGAIGSPAVTSSAAAAAPTATAPVSAATGSAPGGSSRSGAGPNLWSYAGIVTKGSDR